MRLQTCRRKLERRSQRRGTALVEMAVVMPFFLLILFACFEFLRFESLQGMAKIASYEAARTILVPGAVKQEGIDAAIQKLNIIGAHGVNVIVTAYDANGEQDEITDGTWAVTVRVEVPVNANMFSVAQFVKNQTIVCTTTLTSETYDGFYDESVFE